MSQGNKRQSIVQAAREMILSQELNTIGSSKRFNHLSVMGQNAKKAARGTMLNSSLSQSKSVERKYGSNHKGNRYE